MIVSFHTGDGACEAMTEYVASIAKCWYNKVTCTETVVLRQKP